MAFVLTDGFAKVSSFLALSQDCKVHCIAIFVQSQGGLQISRATNNPL